MDYQEIYEHWSDLPDCHIHFGGECMWGKQLPDGTIGLNNNPLQNEYRWQDIVRDVKPWPEILHRRWPVQVGFTNKKKRKQDIREACHFINGATLSHWDNTSGWVLCKNHDVAIRVTAALTPLTTGIEEVPSDTSRFYKPVP